MTANVQQNQVQTAQPAEKPNDKEYNFRQLEQKYEKQLAAERAAREQAERLAKEALTHQQKHKQIEEDDDNDTEEPYVDHKKFKKEQAKLKQSLKQETQSDIERAVQKALQEERKQNWIKNNNDFYDIMQHADKLYQTDPELAETILEMPEGFERQKLVYKNIKALGLHKPPEPKQSSIQEKIDANKRTPYYMPSGISNAPYQSAGDFSDQGQKNAYSKMQELKKKLRI